MKSTFAPASRAAWTFVVVALVALISLASFGNSGSITDGERAEALNDQFACPVCDGQSVAESNVAAARTIRDFIRDEIDAGATDTDIRNSLVNAYGTEVLLNPPSDGIAVLVWVLPVMVLVGGAALVTSTVVGGRRSSLDPTHEDEALVAELRTRGRDDR